MEAWAQGAPASLCTCLNPTERLSMIQLSESICPTDIQEREGPWVGFPAPPGPSSPTDSDTRD